MNWLLIKGVLMKYDYLYVIYDEMNQMFVCYITLFDIENVVTC